MHVEPNRLSVNEPRRHGDYARSIGLAVQLGIGLIADRMLDEHPCCLQYCVTELTVGMTDSMLRGADRAPDDVKTCAAVVV